MRLWDRITGGAATIEIECDRAVYQPGTTVHLRAAITSEDSLEAKSALVTLRGVEEIRYEAPVYAVDGGNAHRDTYVQRGGGWGDGDRRDDSVDARRFVGSASGDQDLRQIGTEEKHESTTTVNVEQRVAGPLHSESTETCMFEADVQIPHEAPPTYVGPNARHYYRLTVALDVAWSKNPSQTVDVIVGIGETAD